MKDFDAPSVGELAAWARARIAADTEALITLAKAAGVLEDDQIVARGLNIPVGFVMIRDPATGAVYAPGPTTTLIGQTENGEEHLWRDGELIYAMDNPAIDVE